MWQKKLYILDVFVVKNTFEKSPHFSFRLLSNMGGALRDVTKVNQSIAIAGKRYLYEAKLPNRCIAAGCSNTAKPCVALYKFPKDPVL